MKDPSQFTTTEMAAIAQDNSGDLKKVASIMGDFLGQDGSELPGEVISKVSLTHHPSGVYSPTPWGLKLAQATPALKFNMLRLSLVLQSQVCAG